MVLEYEDLEMNNGVLSESAKEKLQALLTIYCEGNVIYICHPRHLFGTLEENANTKEIVSVDLDSMNVDKMLSIGDYGRYSIVEQLCSKSNNQFTYLMKRVSHTIKKYRSTGAINFSYPLVILEEKYSQFTGFDYFVRGIISCNQDGIRIAFNPLAMRELPKTSTWEKGLRLGDNYDIL